MTTSNESDRVLLYRLHLLAQTQNWQAIERITEKYLQDNAKELSSPGVVETPEKSTKMQEHI